MSSRLTNKLTLALLVFSFFGCGGSQTPLSENVTKPAGPHETEISPESAVDPDLLVVARSLPDFRGWTLVPVAQFHRGLRHAIVVWPAISPGGIVEDDDVVGITLERTADGSYRLADTPGSRDVWNSRWRDHGSGSISPVARELGGSDVEVRERSEGAPLDELGALLESTTHAFAAEVSRGNRDLARRAAVEFSRLVALEQVVFDDWPWNILQKAATGRLQIQHLGTRLVDGHAKIEVSITVPDRPAYKKSLPAVKVRKDRWVIVGTY